MSSKKNSKKNQFIITKNNIMTGVWFDTCLRLKNTLEIMLEIFGNRKISIARELTKTYEEVIKSDLKNIKNIIDKREKNNNALKGELVLIVQGYSEDKIDVSTLSVNIKDKLSKLSLRDTVNQIMIETKLPKKLIYDEAVKIRNKK